MKARSTIILNLEERDKIIYDRSFLLALRLSPLSLVKPANCEDNDVILEEPITADSIPECRGELTEDYFSSDPQNNFNRKRVITGISLENDQKLLHASEKPWKPGHKDQQKENKNKNLESSVLYIMNRLTPSNFKKLAEEMMALEITTFEDLELVVSTVFDKVAIETKFVQAYASLCQVMLGLQVEPPPTIPKNKATFRAILVTKCQKAFEADKSVIFESAEEIKKRIMEEMKEDTPSRAEKIETTLYQMKLSQMKFFGNISFICELFKLGILPEVIIHSCITKLLSCTDDESLFSLCRLITAVGKHIDTKKSKAQIDKYFTRITQLAAISKSRLKFALSDVLDLRKNKWVPRTKTTGPKTLEEIHKDFKEEQSVSESPKPKPKKPLKREATTDIRPSTTTRASKTSNPAEVKEDKRQCKAGNDSDKENECNWTQVKSKGKASQSKKQTGKISKEKKQADAGRFAKKNEMPPNTATKTFDVIPEVSDDFTVRKMEKKGSAESTLRYDLSDSENEQLEEPKVESIDFSRFKLSKSKVEDDDIILAPRGKTMFSFLSRPSQENKSTSKTKNTEERIENKTNRFSLLLDVSTDESLDAVLSEEPKQRASKVNAKSIQSGAGVSNKIKKLPFVENPKQGTVSPQVVVKLSEDELQTKTLSIIDEFINCRDKKEACLCIDELKSRADMNQFITVTVNHVLEKTDGIRQQIGELFDDLLKTQIITVEDVTKGFSEVMVFAEDIVIDVPKLWAYLAQLIAPLLNHTLLWSNLEPMICCHLQPKNSAIMLAHILKLLLDKQMTVAEIQKGWNASSLNWTQFMEQDRVVEFLDERGINQIFSTSECKEREINSVDTLDSNIDHCEIVDTLCERPEPQKDSSERPEPQIDSSERPEPQIDSNESSEPQIDSSESSEPQVDSSEITVGHGQMDATEIVSSQIECDIQLECDNIFKNESESMPVELKIPNISITGEDCLIKYPTSEMPNLEPVVGSASLLTSDLVMAQHFNNSPSDVVVCENSFSNELLETADENDGRQIDQDTRSEFSDEEGFETWSREMEEDEAGFFISCYTSEAGAKKLFVCRLPFEIAGSDEEEEDGGEDMADDETVIRSFLNDTTQAKSLTDYKVVSGNENLRNCLHRDISASQHDSSSVLEATAHNGSGTSSPQRDSLCLGEMYADLAQNKWSSVYLDPSALQYLEADNTESISSQPIDFNSTNMGFISSIPNDSTRIKAYPIRSNCTADGILRSQHPDGYIWGNKLYTFEDHKRYLQSLEKSIINLSSDAPWFNSGRPAASSGDKTSVAVIKPDDSSGDKISVDAPCFVPGRPVASSGDKISVDAPCFVPGRSVDSSVDKISVDAPYFVPGRPVDSSGDKISLAAPCFVPGRPVDSSGDKNSVAAASCRDDYMNGPLPLQDQAEVFLGNSVNKRQQNNFSNSACDLKQNIDSSCHFQTSFQNYNFSPGCIASNHSTSGQTSASNSMQFNFSQKPPEHPRQSCSNTYVRGVSNYGFSSVGSDLSNLSINQPKKVGVSTFGFDAVSTNKSHYTNVARDDLRATSSNASVNCAIDHSSILNMFLGRSQTSSSQLSVDVLSYLALSQAAASSLETMLRNKSSNQDIIQFIKEAIVGKVLDGALLSIFMTALACSFLNDVKESIVKERKEIISFVLARDVSKEMEAIQILNLVLCQFGYPQGISVLLQELVTEELVSYESLQTLFCSISDAHLRRARSKYTYTRPTETPTADEGR